MKNNSMPRSIHTLCLTGASAVALLGVGCGNPHADLQNDSGAKIVGGQPVTDAIQDARRFSTVALTTDIPRASQPDKAPIDNGSSFCSGTVIGKRVIMTAAHCTQDFDQNTRIKKPGLLLPSAANFLVFFGNKVSRSGKWIKAEKVIPHADWDPSATLSPSPSKPPNDIALIILSEDIPAEAKPAKISPVSDEIKNGEAVYLAGYGVTRSRNNNDTGTLRTVQVSMNSSEKKSQRFVVGAFFKGSCAGDSGGPAYIKRGNEWFAIGATSTGIELLGNCVGLVNNYTDARYYVPWINSTLAANGLTLN